MGGCGAEPSRGEDQHNQPRGCPGRLSSGKASLAPITKEAKPFTLGPEQETALPIQAAWSPRFPGTGRHPRFSELQRASLACHPAPIQCRNLLDSTPVRGPSFRGLSNTSVHQTPTPAAGGPFPVQFGASLLIQQCYLQ